MSIQESNDFEKIRDIIKNIKVAMLVTAENELSLNSRPMHTVDIDKDNNIWFFTSDDSGKVKAMMNDHHVNLSYASPEDGQFLSVSGIATFSDDQNRKEDLFNMMTKAWFPEGVNDPNLLLIKVHPQQAEYWDTSASKLVQLFRVVKALAKDEVYEGGEHGKINTM